MTLLTLSSLLSQSIEKTYYRNGDIKLEVTYEKNQEISSKSFFKNGQIRLEKNKKLNFIKEYYKSGQLKYYCYDHAPKKEEYYNKEGVLIAKFLGGKLEYSLYENVESDIKKLHSHEHEHEHGHGHGHSH